MPANERSPKGKDNPVTTPNPPCDATPSGAERSAVVIYMPHGAKLYFCGHHFRANYASMPDNYVAMLANGHTPVSLLSEIEPQFDYRSDLDSVFNDVREVTS